MTHKRKTWRCFHCDDVFRSRKAATLHFGSDEYEAKDLPACIDPLRADEKARMDAVRKAEQYALACQESRNQAEIRAEDAESELAQFKHVTGCRSIHDLRMWLDSQQGRVVTANALIAGFPRASPELVACPQQSTKPLARDLATT
jgi:hypothetical protein